MERVDRDENDVVVEVGEFDHLLHVPVDIGAYKSGEYAYAVVNMDDVVADFYLIQFLEAQRQFT